MSNISHIEISDTTVTISRGPVTLDIEMAREHGWTQGRINDFWEEVQIACERNDRELQRERPDLHAIASDGSIVHTGPKFRVPSDTRFERKMIYVRQGPKPPRLRRIPKVTKRSGTPVDAVVVGDWAAHRGLGPDFGHHDGYHYSVTHVPYGVRVDNIFDQCEAYRTICHLHRLMPDDFDPHVKDYQTYMQAVIAQVLAFEDLDGELGEDFKDKQGGIY